MFLPPGLLVDEIFGEYEARRKEAAARFSALVLEEIAAGRFIVDGRRMLASHVNFRRADVGLVVSIPLSDRDLDFLRPAGPLDFGCEPYGEQGAVAGDPAGAASGDPAGAASGDPAGAASGDPPRREVQLLLCGVHDRFASAAARALQPAVRVLLEACQAKARRCECTIKVGMDTRSMLFEFSLAELRRLVPDRGDPVLALQLACQDGGVANAVKLYRLELPHRPSTQETLYRVVLSQTDKETELPRDLGL
jgi:hypothetical protein